jgi:hypothetical protein
VIIPHILLNVSYKPDNLAPPRTTLKLREKQNQIGRPIPSVYFITVPKVLVKLLASEKPPSPVANNLAVNPMSKTLAVLNSVIHRVAGQMNQTLRVKLVIQDQTHDLTQ